MVKAGARRGMWGIARRSVALVVAVSGVTACAADQVVVPRERHAILYLALNELHLGRNRLPERLAQYALLLTSGRPTEPAHYRSARRFDMHRASDGEPFAWQEIPAELPPDAGSSPDLGDSNFFLPSAAAAAGLGADSLRPGERYELTIDTEGLVIHGSVTIPDQIVPSIIEREERPVAAWSPVDGAAGYRIQLPGGEATLTTDTAYRVPDEAMAKGWIEVHALDPNLWYYMTDGQRQRAGIDQGYGVFGAITVARLEF